MTDAARWKATVYVGGLAPLVTVTSLHDAFVPFGEIADVSLPKNENPNSTDIHRGFAYVEYEDADDAKEAIDNMDQSEFFGRVIKVSAAKAPKSADEGLGSKKAVWEQVSLYINLIASISLSRSHPLRKDGSPKMWLVKRIVWLLTRPRREGIPVETTQCKGWRDWMLLDPNLNDDVCRNLIPPIECTLKAKCSTER